jgi:hypothetical protein
MLPNLFFVKINTYIFQLKKVSQKWASFSVNLLKVNNRPKGENFPNLVTLVLAIFLR